MSEENEIMNVDEISVPQILTTSNTEFDTQIATAKKFKRNVPISLDNAKATATRTVDAAMTCGYLLPRDGKMIPGQSVHLARICAQAYGNLRIAQQVIGEDNKYVIAEAVAWDLETNYAVKTQWKQLIIKKTGERYKNSEVQTNGMAAMAKAMRNSIFAVIPKSFYMSVYDATRRKIAGELTTEDQLILKRKEMLVLFEKNYGISEDKILKYFKFRQATQIKQEEIVQLIDMAQSFKDGAITPNEIFDNTINQEQAQKVNEKLTGKGKATTETKNTEPPHDQKPPQELLIGKKIDTQGQLM